MTTMDTSNMTDAQMAAEFSIEATRQGRLELAEALLRVAMQAHRAERRPETVDVPFAGHTRHEVPRLRAATPIDPDDVARARDAAQLAPAATAVIPMPTGEQISSNDGSRCIAKVLKGNVYVECHGALFWVPPQFGDTEIPAHWAHIDRALEQDHQASV